MRNVGTLKGTALLAQAVISRALLEEGYDYLKSAGYTETYGPIIACFNDLYPKSVVTDPASVIRAPHSRLSMQHVAETAGPYFLCLCGILKDYGVDLDIIEAFNTCQQHKWLSKRMFLEKPIEFLEHYTRICWIKEVYRNKKEVKLRDGEFAIHKYTVNGMQYERIYGSVAQLYHDSTIMVFKPVKEDI